MSRLIKRKLMRDFNIKELFDFKAFCKYHKAKECENMKALYNMGDVRGRWAERVLQGLIGDKIKTSKSNQNTHGYDIIINGKKWEVKTTSSIQQQNSKHGTAYLQIGGLKGKIDKCYGIIFLDLVNYKMFCIKHNDFFYNDKIQLISQGKDLSFRWFVDYDEYKTLQKVKRNLLEDGTYKLRSENLSINTKAIKNYESV
tara:strand:- start:375 stop:971 length:597 start_codon:yes stop_codon:yes gene_type:complete